jgi:uncharacterized protein YcbX
MKKHVASILSIHRYPVKSMAGENVASVTLGRHGIEGDRRYAFLRKGDESGFPWLNASKLPEMILYRPVITGDVVSVETPGGKNFDLKSDELARELSSKHGTDLRIVHLSSGIFDDAAVSIISTATLKHLETESGVALDIRRFRPNIAIEAVDDTPFGEDAFVGKTLSIGEGPLAPLIAITLRDVRCVMINFDPDSAEANPLIFKTVGRVNNACAGVYGSVLMEGTIVKGAKIFLGEP